MVQNPEFVLILPQWFKTQKSVLILSKWGSNPELCPSRTTVIKRGKFHVFEPLCDAFEANGRKRAQEGRLEL